MIDFCSQNHKLCGNNVKTCFMMVYTAISAVSSLFKKNAFSVPYNTVQQQKVLKSLMWFKHAIILNENFTSYIFKELSSSREYLNHVELKRNATKIIGGSLCGKYSSQASTTISDLILNLFEDCISLKSFVSVLLHIKQYFDFIVFEVPGVILHESKVVQGILLKKEFPYFVVEKPTATQKLIVATFDDALLPTSDINFEFTNNVNLFLTFSVKYLKIWLDKCMLKNITVILFQGKALETFRSLCEENNIGLIDCILEEEINFLSSALEIVPVCDIGEELNPSNICNAKISEVRFGNQTLTNLVSTNNNQEFCSLLICSPSPGLCCQYKASIYNALLVLQHWMFGCNNEVVSNDVILTSSIQSGGFFFIALSKLLSNIDLVQSVIKDNWTSVELDMFKCAYNIVHKMLLVVPQVLHQNSFKTKDKASRFIEYLHKLSIDCAKLDFPKPQSLIEPTNCQYTVFSNALECFMKIIKIDGILR